MKNSPLKYVIFGLVVLAVLLSLPFPGKKELGTPRDWPAIAAGGTLNAVTEYNAISFHATDDTTSGFHYELIQAFARDHGLRAVVTPEMSYDTRLTGLANGTFDLIAYGLPNTTQLKDSLLLTTPIILSKQVLVQRKPTPEDSTTFIRSQLQLAGKTVHVAKGSPAILRIHHLGTEIADTIYINEVERYGSEQLIAMVAHGDIDYVVCDETIARAAADSLPQIDTQTAISFTQFYSWAVSKQSPVLLDSLDRWLKKFKEGKEYKKIYRKYYK